jgi:hypothetical protein
MSWLPGWFKPQNKPVLPVPDSSPDKTPWMRVWLTLRAVNLKELWPVFVSIPAIVFFAISGFIAWLYLIARACVSFVRRLFK